MRVLTKLGISTSSFRAVSLLTLSTAFTALFAFLSQLLFARGFGPQEYGALATALASITLLSPLAGFGVGKFWLRIFGAEGWEGRRWLKSSLLLVAAATLASLAVLVLWTAAAGIDPLIATLSLILAPTVIQYPLSELVYARFQLEERYASLALWQMVPNLSRFTIAVIAGASGLMVVQAAVGLLLGSAIVASVFALFVSTMFGGCFRLAGHGARPADPLRAGAAPSVHEVVGGAWPFALAGAFYLVYFQSDVLLLGWLSGPEAAGIYNVAFAVMAAVFLLPSIIHQKFLLPKLHRWAEHDRDRFLRAFRFGNAVTLLLGVLVMVVVLLAAPWGIRLLFGAEYQEAGSVLVVLALSIPGRYLATSVGSALVTQDHMRRKVWLMGGSALVNLLLNLALIPRYSMYGAAVATVCSELVLLVAYLIAVRQYVLGPEALSGWSLTVLDSRRNRTNEPGNPRPD